MELPYPVVLLNAAEEICRFIRRPARSWGLLFLTRRSMAAAVALACLHASQAVQTAEVRFIRRVMGMTGPNWLPR